MAERSAIVTANVSQLPATAFSSVYPLPFVRPQHTQVLSVLAEGKGSAISYATHLCKCYQTPTTWESLTSETIPTARCYSGTQWEIFRVSKPISSRPFQVCTYNLHQDDLQAFDFHQLSYKLYASAAPELDTNEIVLRVERVIVKISLLVHRNVLHGLGISNKHRYMFVRVDSCRGAANLPGKNIFLQTL